MTFTKKLILTILLFACIGFSQTKFIQASDFNITSTYNIYLKNLDDNFVTVEEDVEITTNNPSYYIPKNSEQKFSLKKENLIKDSLSVTNRYGRNLDYTVKDDKENLQIVVLNTVEIKKDSPFFARVSYQTTEYVKHNGNNVNLYLPGLSKDVKFQEVDKNHGLVTKHQYLLSYHIPIDSPKESLIFPNKILTSTDNNLKTYTFPSDIRVGQSGWIQLGTEQYYYFKILQNIPKTDFVTPDKLTEYTGWLSTNIVEITLPTDFEENNQKTYFTKFSPEPKKIKTDSEGNIIGIFEIEANKEQAITIEGYIELAKKDKDIPSFTLEQYLEKVKGLNRLTTYTQPDKYWEVDNPLIQSEAKSILAENTGSTILDLIRANYKFVIETLQYSHEKAKNENIRVGALKALQGSEAVCMEYADLLLSLLRAQGIPARAAFGYGNDPLAENSAERQVGHQWVQVWYPEYGWLSIDPTWGETGREYIGADLDHILWYTASDSEEKISDSAIYSADSITNQTLKDYDVTITPLHKSEIPDLSEIDGISDIVLKYTEVKNPESTEIEYVLKTTMFGRALVFIAPILIVLFIITASSILISRIFKGNTKNS